MVLLIISLIISIVLALMAIGYAAHCAVTFQKFNDGIKNWAESLDEIAQDAIDRSARKILREMDAKISEQNEQLKNNKNDE